MAHASKTKPINVDGVPFQWSVERNPKYSSSHGWQGLALRVASKSGEGRSLVVQLPFRIDDHGSTPHRQRPTVAGDKLAEFIRGALKSGWDPTKRGKTFLYIVPENDAG